ncbi:MAG: SiaB family protein kinase [Bacteroidota bacterium]|nr:SiaB family protein kinase [Bacteroidota bacterium]
MSFNLEDCYTKMNAGEVLLAYRGSITAELITNVLGVVETKLDSIINKSSTKKKIYNILVESLQNLFHHIDELPEEYIDNFDVHFGVFVVSKISNKYKISTGNFINNDKVESLEKRLKKIISLSRDELKEMYKFVLNNQQFSDKGGGGLGLIDIARRTNGYMDYNIEKFDSNYSFFNLNVYIEDLISK